MFDRLRPSRTLRARTLIPSILAVLLSACGGGGDGGGGGTTPPPPARTPSSVTFDNGSTAAGTVGAALSGTITVTVRASDNGVLANTPVTFSASAGTVSTTSTTTDASGRATAGTWTLGNTAGAQTLTATAGTVSAQLTATAAAGAPASLEIVTGLPATIRAGAPVTPAPVLRVKDQFNNVVNRAGTVVTAALAAGTGTLTGNTATSDANGIATFANLTLGGLVSEGPRTIGFSSTGVPTVTSPPVALEAGATASITLSNVPTTARAGVAIAPVIVARLADSFGNPMGRTTTVTASVLSGGGTLSGATATTNAQGDAAFSTLSIDGAVGTRTLRFTADQSSVNSAAITLAPGDPSQLQVTSQPTVVENTVPFPSPVIVRVTDRFGNGVGGPSRGVTVALASGGGVLIGAAATTDAVGVATFSGLRIVGSAGPRTLTFSTAGLSAALSQAIDLAAGPPRFLAFFQQPSATVTAGVPILQQPALQLADTSGNIVRRAGTPVRATLLDAPGELVNDVAVTDAQGVARFEQLTFLAANSFPPPTLRLRFSSGAQAAVVTGNLQVQNTPGNGANSVQYGTTAQKLFVVDAGATLNLSATVRDLLGGPLPQVPVVYHAINANVATVRATGAITGVGGGATWVRAFGAGNPNVADSVYVAVPRDATAPVVRTTLVAPLPLRAGVTTGFDLVIDTRDATVGAATILISMPPEAVNGISWQGTANTQIGFDQGFNNLRISFANPAGIKGLVTIASLTITAEAAQAFTADREIIITPIEMFDINSQNLASRSTGVNIPLIR